MSQSGSIQFIYNIINKTYQNKPNEKRIVKIVKKQKNQ